MFYSIDKYILLFVIFAFMKIDYDYIIVGLGLAGISFCEQLRANNKTFIVLDDLSQKSSTVAGGLYNPVVLKRFTPIWKGDEQLNLVLTHYKQLEQLLNVKLDYKTPVYRKFTSIEEQNKWFAASDKPKLTRYLADKIITNTNPAINAKFGFGEVLLTGRVDVKQLITSYKTFLKQNKSILEASFNYDALQIKNKSVIYNSFAAKQIVFSEGFGVTKNPYFSNVPLRPTKGELLTIYAPDLHINFVLKGPVFIIPIGDDIYVVGATYDLYNLNHNTTEEAKTKLLKGLDSMISCTYSIVNQKVGIRPTVKDRKPLIGRHKNYKNLYILNGLGTRGVMIGPYVAKQLFNFIEYDTPLDNEINITRVN